MYWPGPHPTEIKDGNMGYRSDYEIQEMAGSEEIISLDDFFYEVLLEQEDKDIEPHQEFITMLNSYNDVDYGRYK